MQLNTTSNLDVYNIVATVRFTKTTDGSTVEFDKEGIAEILRSHDSVSNSVYPDKAPFNTRIEFDDENINTISISDVSMITRQKSIQQVDDSIQMFLDACDDLDPENDIYELWEYEYDVNTVMASDEIEVEVNLVEAFDELDAEERIEYMNYRPSMGYLNLHLNVTEDENNTQVSLYNSGKFTIKGGESIEHCKKVSEEIKGIVNKYV